MRPEDNPPISFQKMMTLQKKKMSKLNNDTRNLRSSMLGNLLHHCNKLNTMIDYLEKEYEII